MYNFQPNPRYTIKTDGSLVNYGNHQPVLGRLGLDVGSRLESDVFVYSDNSLSRTIDILGYNYNRLIYRNSIFSLHDQSGNEYQLLPPHQHIPLNLGISPNGTTLHIPEIRHSQQFISPPVAPHQRQVTPQNTNQATVIQVPVERRVEVPVEVPVEKVVERIVYQDRVIKVQNEQTLQQLQLAQAQARQFEVIQRDLVAQIKQKDEALERNRIQIEGWLQFSKQHDSQTRELEFKLKSKEEEINRLQQQTKLLIQEAQRAGAESSRKDLEREATSAISEAQNQATLAQHEVKQKSQELELLKIQLRQTRESEESAHSYIMEIESKINIIQTQHQDQISELTQKLVLATQENKRFISTLDEVQKINDERDAFEARFQSAQQEREDLTAQVQELQKQLTQVQELRAALATQSQDLGIKLDNTKAEVERLRTQLALVAKSNQDQRDAAQRQVEGLRAGREAARGEAAELRARLPELEAAKGEVERLRGERDAAQAAQREAKELRTKLAELEAAQAAKREAEAAQATQVGELEVARREVEGLRTELAAKDEEIGRQRQAIDDKERQLANRDGRADALASEITRLRGELEEARAEAAQARQLQAAGGESERLRGERDAAQAAQREAKELHTQLAAVRGELDTAQVAQREALAAKNEAALATQAARSDLVARAQKDKASLDAQFQELKTQRVLLQDKEIEIEYLKLEAFATQARGNEAARREAEARAEFTAKDASARSEAEGLRTRIAELEAALTTKESELGERQAALAAQAAELEAALTTTAAIPQRAQAEADGLRREREALNAQALQLEVTRSDLVARAGELKTQRVLLQDKELEIDYYLKHEALATQAKGNEAAQRERDAAQATQDQATQRNQVRSGGGGTPSASASRPTASQLVTYKFELVDADSTDYKLLRLTYLGGGDFNNKSVEFRILTRNSLVESIKGNKDRGAIIKDFLFGKIQQFNNKNSRIDDENIKRFFSSEDTKIETVGVVSMDLLKEIIKAKRLQTQDRGRSGARR
jgi:hypothetical protein